MTSWMTCTTCKRVVVANETGICLACQRGFTQAKQEDNYMLKEWNDYYPPEELQLWEKIDAAEERIKQIDDKQKYQDRDELEEIPEAGGGDCISHCW